MRSGLIFAVVVVAASSAAAADPASGGAEAPILDRIEKGPDRKAAIDELMKVAPQTIDGLGTFLARKHTTDVATRTKVLDAIHAAVPDKNGRFQVPERKSDKEEKADDDLDWMAGLLALDPSTEGIGEVIADDAAIRALAATNDIHAAQLLFDVAFGDETMIYRDECGRYLRKMSPYSIPALLQQSQDKNYDRKRYATFQLERLDRQEPHKALAAANADEALTLAILDVFKATHYREAVHAVWSKVDADSSRVRAKAREAWMEYITGPPPPPAPKKKLQLPGGKLTKKEKPLWLTYRELADNELRKAANELLHEDYPLEDPTLDDSDENGRRKPKTVKVDLEELTKRLFDYYDEQRAKKEGDQWAAAKALADKGDLAGASGALDRIVAATLDPTSRKESPEMAKIYFAYAKQLEGKQQWLDASAAYSKAQGLDPKGPSATQALAAHHYTLGKALEAAGKDGGPDFRAAIKLDSNYAPAKAAEREVERRGRPTWMLYCAALAAAAAAGLFAMGMLKRKA